MWCVSSLGRQELEPCPNFAVCYSGSWHLPPWPSWPPRWPFWPPWPTEPICPFTEYSAVCQHQTIFCWPTAKYKAKLLKIMRSVSFWFGLFSAFPSPQPPSLEDEILRHLGPWERDQVKSTRAARQDTDGTNMTNRLVVNAGTGLLHNLAGGMLMLLLRALFSLFSQMHLG